MRRPASVAVHQVADHLIEPLIQPPDVAEICLRLVAAPRRVLVVRVPPEHVRLQIAAGEIEEQQPVVVIVDRVVEQGQPLLQDDSRLFQILVVGEDAVLAGAVVLLEAGGVEQAELLGDVLDERRRFGYLLGRGAGSMLTGLTYSRKCGETSCRVEADDAAHLGEVRPGGVEVDRRPAAPLAGLQQNLVVLHLKGGRVRLAVAVDFELDAERLLFPARRVLRSNDFAPWPCRGRTRAGNACRRTRRAARPGRRRRSAGRCRRCRACPACPCR